MSKSPALNPSYIELFATTLIRNLMPSGNDYAGYFTYTSWGDPEKITWNLKTTGRPDYFFTYDNKRRLTRFEGLYNSSVFDFVTIYNYEGDKITGDSSWFTGTDVNNFRGSAFVSSASQYTYDMKGRIIKVDGKIKFGMDSIITSGTFNYDAAGNLVIPGTMYDNKKSFLRTNAWLMLVTKNFSANNQQVADEYNKKGLPLTYNSTVLPFLNSLINEIEAVSGFGFEVSGSLTPNFKPETRNSFIFAASWVRKSFSGLPS